MTLLQALTIVTNLSIALQEITMLIQAAKLDGRDYLTEEEMKIVNDKYEASFSSLRKAIEAKEAG